MITGLTQHYSLMVSESLGDEAWDALLEGRHKLLREISSAYPDDIVPPYNSRQCRVYITIHDDSTAPVSRFAGSGSSRPDFQVFVP